MQRKRYNAVDTMQQSLYSDKRSAFWKERFSEASRYQEYLAQSDPDKAGNWRRMEKKLPPLSDTESKRLKGYGRCLHVLVVSGVWCGDCVRQGPILRQLSDACDPEVELRLIDRDVNADLREEVRLLGALRVPVVVFLSEDFFEVGRFGDRMLSTYRLKAQTELGPACPVPSLVPPDNELREERGQWLDVFERMLLMVRLAPPLRERHGD